MLISVRIRIACGIVTAAIAISLGISGGGPVYGQGGGELGVLSLDVNSAGEADIRTTAKIIRSGDTALGLTVKLTSSDPTELYVPASVQIPVGKTSVDVILEIVNDGDIDGVQSVTVNASAPGYADMSQGIEVSDDDALDRRTLGGHLFGKVASDTYVVLSSITVDEGRTLEIEPGSTLGFGSGVSLTAYGSLVAVGEPNKEILFTRDGLDNAEEMADWQIARVALPANDYWEGIKNPGSAQQDSELSYVVIQFAKTGLVVNGVQPTILISNSSISQNSTDGLVINDPSSSHVQILENKIHHNGATGISVSAYSSGCEGGYVAPIIKGNEIYTNRTGISLSASSSSGSLCWPFRESASIGGEVRANHIHHNTGTGITAVATRYWIDSWLGRMSGNGAGIGTLISNNIVVANDAMGLSLRSSGDYGGNIYCKVSNNTVVESGDAGIWHSANAHSGFTVQNNIVFRNGKGIAAGSSSDPNQAAWVISYNDVADNNDNNWVNYPAAYGNVNAADANGIPVDIAMNMSVDPCFVEVGHWDPNGTPDNLEDDFWVAGDYHLQSAAGRWDPVTEAWVTDDTTSPCIDAGDPKTPVGDEPQPNGGRVNMGAYGGTAEASKSKGG